jgi:hypothetical protein
MRRRRALCSNFRRGARKADDWHADGAGLPPALNCLSEWIWNVGLRTQRAWLVIAATPDQTRYVEKRRAGMLLDGHTNGRRRLIPSQSRRKHDDEVASFDFAEFDCVV